MSLIEMKDALTQVTGRQWAARLLIAASSLVALAAFAWPFFAAAAPEQLRDAVPVIAFAVLPVLGVLISLTLEPSVNSAKSLALLGVLAAVGSVVRIATTGVAGFEAVFIVLILGGRVLGARFGFLLGMLTIVLSAVVTGGLGPWTPFQMFAAGWVAAGAGLLPGRASMGRRHNRSRRDRWIELSWVIGYAIVASYLFGAIMNLWFWPFAVGSATSISYVPGGSVPLNLSHFTVYTLVTSTLTWDTVRAVTTAAGIALIGPVALAALRRAKIDV